MPIAAMGDDYPEEHWRRVRKILQRAIERAGMRSQLVWENPEVDVIQSAILQNLYENDVVVCDVSGLNPNVMLEAGLRLSTKKPTVIVTDRKIKPPFDIGIVGYIDYQFDLEYNAIEDFIERLRDKIAAVRQAHNEGNYKSFVEHFTFETVTPSTVNVSGEEYLKEQIDTLVAAVRRIESKDQAGNLSSSPSRNTRVKAPIANIRILADDDKAFDLELSLDSLAGFGLSKASKLDGGEYLFIVPVSKESDISVDEARTRITDLLRQKQVRDYKLHFS